MKVILFCCAALLCNTILVKAQNVSDFMLFNDQRRVMCYTERENGIPLKNTTASFTNLSSCSGNCWYVWNFGETSEQRIVSDNSLQSYTYTKDGQFSVSLALVNTEYIHDSIKLRPVSQVVYTGISNDSARIEITYIGVDNQERIMPVLIPQSDYNAKISANQITVYSPKVSSHNFVYEIDDPSSETQKAPLQSFSYILEVDNSAFISHNMNIWTYYWEIYATNEFGEKTQEIAAFSTDSLRHLFTFPLEHYKPGYYVNLKIALDTSKFDDEDVLNYHSLWNCTASQYQIIPVTDYFFTEETREDPNLKKRKAHVPNIFTPGGGDENEVFYFNTNGVDVFTVYIYNSWGNLVFKEQAHTVSWTGKDNAGRDCPSGTYYYVIYSDNLDNRHETAGHIHLFRQN